MSDTPDLLAALQRSLDDARAEDDLRRVRNELRDRLNTLDDATKLDALAELAHTHPDEVNNALNEIGASDV